MMQVDDLESDGDEEAESLESQEEEEEDGNESDLVSVIKEIFARVTSGMACNSFLFLHQKLKLPTSFPGM